MMWQFMTSVTSPPKKAKQTDAEKAAVSKIYEKEKRERKFQSAWEKRYPWLLYDGKNMFCRPCRSSYGLLSVKKLPDGGAFKKYSTGPFVTGCHNFKLDIVKGHDLSEGHRIAVDHVKHSAKKVGESPAEKALKQLNVAVFEKLEKIFRNAHAIAKNNRPYSDLKWLCTLDEKKD